MFCYPAGSSSSATMKYAKRTGVNVNIEITEATKMEYLVLPRRRQIENKFMMRFRIVNAVGSRPTGLLVVGSDVLLTL